MGEKRVRIRIVAADLTFDGERVSGQITTSVTAGGKTRTKVRDLGTKRLRGPSARPTPSSPEET